MELLQSSDFERMRNVDIRTIDPEKLVDIRATSVNTDLSIGERMRDYIDQIKNPYCFRCGKTVVKISFADTSESMEERMQGYFRSL